MINEQYKCLGKKCEHPLGCGELAVWVFEHGYLCDKCADELCGLGNDN